MYKFEFLGAGAWLVSHLPSGQSLRCADEEDACYFIRASGGSQEDIKAFYETAMRRSDREAAIAVLSGCDIPYARDIGEPLWTPQFFAGPRDLAEYWPEGSYDQK